MLMTITAVNELLQQTILLGLASRQWRVGFFDLSLQMLAPATYTCLRPPQQPVSPACTDVAPLGPGVPQAVPRVGDGQRPRGRCARRGGASQGRTAMGTNMGPPCRSGVAGTPPRTGTQWKQPRGQLLPPVRGNARRRVWRRRTKSRRRSGCRGCTRSGTRSWPRDSQCV